MATSAARRDGSVPFTGTRMFSLPPGFFDKSPRTAVIASGPSKPFANDVTLSWKSLPRCVVFSTPMIMRS
jgi:hypothetical protein